MSKLTSILFWSGIVINSSALNSLAHKMCMNLQPKIVPLLLWAVFWENIMNQRIVGFGVFVFLFVDNKI